MHDSKPTIEFDEDRVAKALRDLPMAPMGETTWAAAASRLPIRNLAIHDHSTRRFPWSIAAALAMLVALPITYKFSATSEFARPTASVQVDAIPSVTTLMSRSQLLEQAWRRSRDQTAVASAHQMLVENQMQDLVHYIDSEIETESNPRVLQELWAHRVAVLEGLNAVQERERRFATGTLAASATNDSTLASSVLN